MEEIVLRAPDEAGIDEKALREALERSVSAEKGRLKKVLLLPPDITRLYSGAGVLTALYYDILKDVCEIDVMPALGTNDPMTPDEITAFFGPGIPHKAFITHNWRTDVVKLGQVPGDYVGEISEGLINEPIDVEVNRRIVDGSYDLILSIGQVVPHEVVGMANYSKNIFVGCGGSNMINKSHMLGAFYGMERIMGKDHSPVRKVFDYAEEHFLKAVPLKYVLTVTTQAEGKTAIHGLFAGRSRSLFEQAVRLSREKNITYVEKPIKKAVVYLDEREFKSTWLGNKAVYRTRMAMADGGELVVLAPGVRKFGEDDINDRLIRKYGYVGRVNVLALCRENEDLKGNLSVAAHLIHGSSDGRFSVTYAVEKLSREEIEGVAFKYAAFDEMSKKYDPGSLKPGFNVLDGGEEIYYIGNPATGLWEYKDS